MSGALGRRGEIGLRLIGKDAGRAHLQIVLSAEALSLFRVVIAEAPRSPELARRFYLAGPAEMNSIVAAYLDRRRNR